MGTQKGTIILTITHVTSYALALAPALRDENGCLMLKKKTNNLSNSFSEPMLVLAIALMCFDLLRP